MYGKNKQTNKNPTVIILSCVHWKALICFKIVILSYAQEDQQFSIELFQGKLGICLELLLLLAYQDKD